MRKKILIVDDSETVLMIEKSLLKRIDVEVVVARDGRQALEQCAQEAPALVLLDVMMPEMDGFDALRELRRRPLTADTPVIMVTTRGEEEYMERALSLGCNDYIFKPIDPSEFIEKVRSFVGDADSHSP